MYSLIGLTPFIVFYRIYHWGKIARSWDEKHYRSGLPVSRVIVRSEMCVSFLASPKKIESELYSRMKNTKSNEKLIFGHSGDRCFVMFRRQEAFVPFFYGNLIINPLTGTSEIVLRLNWVTVGLALVLAGFTMMTFIAVIYLPFFFILGCRELFRAKRRMKQLANLFRKNHLLLGRVGNKPVLGRLLDGIFARDKTVRKAIERVMALPGIREQREGLVAALGDSNGEVRKAAANILGVIGDKHSVKPLIDMMTRKPENDLGQAVAAAEALGLIGDKSAVPALSEALGHKNPTMREIAVAALELIGKDASGPLVAALKNGDAHIRESAARALGKIGSAEFVLPLIHILKDGNQNVREAAARSLGTIQDPRAVGKLANATSKKTGLFNRTAAIALAEFGDARSLKPLIRVVQDAFHHRDHDMMEETKAAFKKLILANKPFQNARRSFLLCSKCLRRGMKKQRYHVSMGIPFDNPRSGSIIFCERCHNVSSLYSDIKQVIGVIGGDHDAVERNGDTLTAPLWDEQGKTSRYAQIDSLVVFDTGVENYDFAINAVILELTADASVSNKWLRKIPVILEGNPQLSQMALGMLRDNFACR